MRRTLFLGIIMGLILLSSLSSSFAQDDLSGFSDKQRITIAQSNVGDAANDRAFWDSVKDSKNPEELRAYIEQFPNGIFSPLAKARLKALEKGEAQSQYSKTVVSDVSDLKETGRDGRFIAYDNGRVLDTKTNLMWAARDNGEDISWSDAKRYCESYSRGGYKDWRMPTEDELKTLYDANKRNHYGYRVTDMIGISGIFVWASETSNFFGTARSVSFTRGGGWAYPMSLGDTRRALPVRFAK